MIISLIVAMDERRGIGFGNKLPWRLPADLKRFRELTMGHYIVMGRKTYESIGKALPGRHTIVVTRNEQCAAKGCRIVHSIDDAIALASENGEGELFICGGAEVYAGALPLADRLYMTLVHARGESDTFFPEVDPSVWVEEESSYLNADEKNQYSLTFKLFRRRR